MTQPIQQESPSTVLPEEALLRIQSHRGPILVDLDETLYLRNSTEDFIANAWPAPLAFFLIKLLDLLAPWRLTGGRATRDVWRVGAIGICMPWTLLVWRYRAGRLAREFTNTRLLARLRASHGEKAIVTLGFRHVVAPLVEAMEIGACRLVAMSGWRFHDRRVGKLASARHVLGDACVGAALVVTDSPDDVELLGACAQPLRVVWPEARFRDAFSETYIPGLYISRVKRPGSKYISRCIVGDELVPWMLASLALAPVHPVLHLAAVSLLAVSFWAVYEYGYVDNDRIAERYEQDGVLTQAFFERPVRTSAVLPWIWAAGTGLAGLSLLRWPNGPGWRDVAAWTSLLLITFGVFWLYNRIDKQSRIWVFAGLQTLRAAAIIVVVPVTLAGMMALAAHALARWVPYYNYRAAGTEWHSRDIPPARLLFFLILCTMLLAVEGPESVWSLTTLALLLWFMVKARGELLRIAGNARWIVTPGHRRAANEEFVGSTASSTAHRAGSS